MTYKHWPETKHVDARRRYCCLCGQAYAQDEMFFKSATAQPSVSETLTGATSGATATISGASLLSGSYADGTANGTIILEDVNGTFEDGELINGSVSGNGFLVCHYYAKKRYGLSYPETQLIPYGGKEYCPFHFKAKLKEILDKQWIPNIEDKYTGTED